MRRIIPQPLTAQAFAPFGEVIEASARAERREINHGLAVRFHDLAAIDVAESGGRAVVSLFRAQPLVPPVLKVMERHRLGSQAFVPLDGGPYLVAVAPAGPLDPQAIQVFRAAGDQGVNYRKGTWHHFLLALEPASFLVIDREGAEEDCDEVELAAADQAMVAL